MPVRLSESQSTALGGHASVAGMTLNDLPEDLEGSMEILIPLMHIA